MINQDLHHSQYVEIYVMLRKTKNVMTFAIYHLANSYKSDRIIKTTEIRKLKKIDYLGLNVEGREIG